MVEELRSVERELAADHRGRRARRWTERLEERLKLTGNAIEFTTLGRW